MRDRLDEFPDGTLTVLVTFTDPILVDPYAVEHQLGYPILVSPDRAAYRAFGLGRGSIARVWGPKAARRYLEILRADGRAGLRNLRRPTEDTLQLGGDFVVDATGKLVYGFWGDGPDDRPPVDDLIAAAYA